MLDLSSQGGLGKRIETMIATVTNLDNTVTTYGYEPAPGRLVALEDYYRNLSDKGIIKGFIIGDATGLLVSHKSI
jgi:hypothetical protein